MEQPLYPVLIEQIKVCCDEWDRVLLRFFGNAESSTRS